MSEKIAQNSKQCFLIVFPKKNRVFMRIKLNKTCGFLCGESNETMCNSQRYFYPPSCLVVSCCWLYEVVFRSGNCVCARASKFNVVAHVCRPDQSAPEIAPVSKDFSACALISREHKCPRYVLTSLRETFGLRCP